MRDFTTDLRFAWRSLWKNPALTAIAVAALALGIGANTAIFSVVHGVLLSPLPYPEPERIVRLIDTNPQANLPRFPTSPPDFVDWRTQNKVFSHLAAIRRANVNLTGEGDPERLVGARVSADFFGLFRLGPGENTGQEVIGAGQLGCVVRLFRELLDQVFRDFDREA